MDDHKIEETTANEMSAEQKAMNEKRRSKRLELSVQIQLSHTDQTEFTTVEYATVRVTDISKTGIGFISDRQMEIGQFFDARIQIWTKEVIDVVLEIIRVEDLRNGTIKYGGSFIGMTDTDALKIEIYQLFNEQED